MSTNCDHNCDSCADSSCASRIEKSKGNKLNKIKHIIGVVSGKGGVGKSFVTSLLASKLNKLGYKVGIIDGDITGPSIPKSFGVKELLEGDGVSLIFPQVSDTGIKMVSSNLLLTNESEAIIWRGQMISSLLVQFYEDVLWEELDYLFIDMPPGTSDVTLTAFQKFPLDGVIVVSTPQELVSMIVKKSINMAKTMNIPLLGLVENMSFVKCPHCDEKIELFGKSKLNEVAKEEKIPSFASLPMNHEFNELVDKGRVQEIELEELAPIVDYLKGLENDRS